MGGGWDYNSPYYSSRSQTATLSSSPKREQQSAYPPPGYPMPVAYSYPPQYGGSPSYNSLYAQQLQPPSYQGRIYLYFPT
jgi:hypothetical protein